MQDFRNLVVWQDATDFVTALYVATQSFPAEEKYGLTSQLRRASVSIASNIAEGQGRLSRGQFRQFLGYAKGSICEVETQLIIAHNVGYLNDPQPLLEKLHAVAQGLDELLDSTGAAGSPLGASPPDESPTTGNRKRTAETASVRAILLY